MIRLSLLVCAALASGCATPGQIVAEREERALQQQQAAYRDQLYRLCRDMGFPPGTLQHIDCMLSLHERNRSNMGASAAASMASDIESR